jgi:hypothetical protein
VNGKPLTIIDLSGVPAEITDVVVSSVCRLTFKFGLWSDRKRLPPVLLVCEEAHRYIPASEPIGFGATSRAITRIAREGRKYGAERQDQTAARNMLGARERFDAVPFFWSQQHDLQLNYVGHAAHWDRVEID